MKQLGWERNFLTVRMNQRYDVIVYKFIRLQQSTRKHKHKNFHFGQHLRKCSFTSTVNAAPALNLELERPRMPI